MRIAIVSREVAPFVGGGIAPYVTQLARALAPVAEVTIVTTRCHEERYEELRRRDDPALPPAAVRFTFVDEPAPHEIGSFFGSLHAYSARVYETLKRLYPDGGPDVVEFSDYLGEGAVTIQAARTRDPALRNATVVVKIHTTAEIAHVLDGWLGRDDETVALYELERYCLRYADVLLYGGGDVHGLYQRYYGRARLAPARCVRQPVADAPPAGGLGDQVADGDVPLRLLYLGRFERRKGVANLVRAVTASSADVRLTMIGGDTQTAPLGASMRATVDLMAAGDERIEVRDPVPPAEVPQLFEHHHAVVVPSLWECWPNVGLEALRANRPLLATPVGGLAEMAGPGDAVPAGWLADGTDEHALRALIERIAAAPHRVVEAVAGRGPRARFERLVEEGPVIEAYRELAERRPRAARRAPSGDGRGGAARPLVSIVVPYFALARYVEETIASLFAQTYPSLEVIVVNDGSMAPEDAEVLERVASRWPVEVVTQPNSGLGAARNLGIALSRGRYVLPFDADDLLDPAFVERCVDVLEADPDVAYVTSWVEYVGEDGRPDPERLGAGFQAISNDSGMLDRVNASGSALAVFRRELFDELSYDTEMTSYEDWLFYRELRALGRHGHVIPERLIKYRIRDRSMMRQTGIPERERLHEEMEAHYRRRRVRWTATA